MSEKHYPTDPAGQLDAGADRANRERPCTERTWCMRGEHIGLGPCVEVPRRVMPPTDFGPKAATRRRY